MSGSRGQVAAAEISFVDLAAQQAEIESEVADGFARVIADTAFIGGPDVTRFEQAWARYCGVHHAVGVASGTDALELALRAIDVGPGDEVIVPTNSFIASAGAIARSGARPVLVDCDRYHLMDVDAVAANLTARTRAIMPVHLYGQLADMEALAGLADRAGVALVEDAAQAHGATRHGRHAGSWGMAAATSFYPGKNLGGYGDGGAVMTDSADLAGRVRALRNHGSQTRYEHPTLGFNSRLDTLQAVVLTAKLARLDRWNNARRSAVERYDSLLGGLRGIGLPEVLPGNEHVWHLYVIRVAQRDRVLERLNSAGIPAAIHYPVPIHLTGAFGYLGYRVGDFPAAELAAHEILSLPLHPHLSSAQQERIAEALAAALE
jgi:dTDP-4-amino-4,6-dideoxygalactose transaminase